MKNDWRDERDKILGLGRSTIRKNYYPELKRKVAALERFKSVLDLIADVVLGTYFDEDRIIYANLHAKKVLAQNGNQINLSDLVFNFASIREQLQKLEEVRIVQSFLVDGVMVPYEMIASTKMMDEVKYILIIGRNIEERVNFEKTLVDEKNKFKSIFDSTYDAIFIHDIHGNILDVNYSVVRMHNLPSRAYALQCTVQDFSSEENDFSVLPDIWGRVLDGERIIIDWIARSPATYKTLDVEVALNCGIFDNQRIVIAVVRDISERKKNERVLLEKELEMQARNELYLEINQELAESYRQITTMNVELQKAKRKAEESDELKSAFLANISHEVRTPLNAILGYSQLITNSAIPDDQKPEYASIILQKGDDLVHIINDILYISKIKTDKIHIRRKPLDLYCFLRERAEEYVYNPYYESKSSDINFWIEDIDRFKAWKEISVDIMHFTEVLNNLVGNAFKFTDKGEVVVRVKEKLDELIFEVHDTGIGIDEKFKSSLFNSFAQGFDRSEKQLIGTGLGLSISKSLVELMGGEIWYQTEVGKGTVFGFSLPLIWATQ